MSIIRSALEKKEYDSLENIIIEIGCKIESTQANCSYLFDYFDMTYLSDENKREIERNWNVIANAVREIFNGIYDINNLFELLTAGQDKTVKERMEKYTEASYALSAVNKLMKI